MELIKDKTLAQIVSLKPSAAAVFEKHDLDFCCKGKRTLKEACLPDEAKLRQVEQELDQVFAADGMVPDDQHFDRMDLGELTEYIVAKHHHYVKESSKLLYAHLEKVSGKHGDRHPELNKIFKLFSEVKEEMDQHMFKEEQILFPRIGEIQEALKAENIHWMPDQHYLRVPIGVMEEEHDHAGNLLHEIKTLTNNYNPPADACTTYRLCFNELKEFELDLHQHVHLENNILFPRAVEMQETLRQVLFN